MKIIVTGATGFIGSEIVRQCIRHPAVTQVVAFSRRRLPEDLVNDVKLKPVLVTDFQNYSEEALEEICEADSWIWALGKAWMPDHNAAMVVHIEYPLIAARTMVEDRNKTTPARFILLSGGAAERDQSKDLWFANVYRKIRVIKGQAENQLLAYGKQNSKELESHIMRPGMVLKTTFNLRDVVRSLGPSVPVDVLAKSMVRVATEGSEKESFENADILELYAGTAQS